MPLGPMDPSKLPKVGRLTKAVRYVQRKVGRFFTKPIVGTAPQILEPVPTDVEEWVDSGQWAHVNSSNVASIKYEYLTRHLHVMFKKGHREYIYSGVSPDAAKSMYYAASMGKHVHRMLKGRYPTAKVS